MAAIGKFPSAIGKMMTGKTLATNEEKLPMLWLVMMNTQKLVLVIGKLDMWSTGSDWQMTGKQLAMIIHKDCISKSLVINW